MKRIHWIALVCVGCCWGCAADPYAARELGEARQTVSGSVEAIGGLRRWQAAGPVRADAVVSLYDEAGKVTVNQQQHTYRLSEGTLAASAQLPGGSWSARATSDGQVALRCSAALSGEHLRRLEAALRMLRHRVRGPINLCEAGERPGEPARVHVAGMDLLRVGVEDGEGDVRAYYFDAQTLLLRLVTAGGDAPGEEGTVTLYRYRLAANGLAFPSRLAVMKIGEHVLVGEQPILEVDFHRVRF